MPYLPRIRWLLLLLTGLLLLTLACGPRSIFGTTSRQAERCPASPHPSAHTAVAFQETVRIAPFTLWLHVGSTSFADAAPDQQLALLTLRWHNPSAAVTTTAALSATNTLTVTGPVSVTYQRVLRITTIQQPNGLRHHGSWTVTQEAVAAAARPLPDTIPVGDALHTVPILIPLGQVEQVELTLPYLGPPDGQPAEHVTIAFRRQRQPIRCP